MNENIKLEEVEFLRLKVAYLESDKIQNRLNEANGAMAGLQYEIAEKYKIEKDEYTLNMDTGYLVKRPTKEGGNA